MSAHYQMLQMLDNSAKSPVNNYPVHPDVKFKRLPFYDLISELIKPSTLMNHSSEYRTQDFHFNFTPQETTTLAMESDIMVSIEHFIYVNYEIMTIGRYPIQKAAVMVNNVKLNKRY